MDEEAPRSIPIRMNCPPLVSSLIMFPGLPRLRREAPELSLTITHNIFTTTLGENDVIIASSLPERGRLMTRRIGSVGFGIYMREGEEEKKDWIGLLPSFDESVPMGLGFRHFRRPPLMRLENFNYVSEAMRAIGLAGPLPDLVVQRDGGYTRVGGPDLGGRVDLWLCYHETRRGDPAIETLTNWLDRCFEEYGEE
jgi:DNA-binding transcriptional LysR family regulator